MDKLSIKINIANRIYPMKIERSSEEYIRKAVKKIEERLKFYEDTKGQEIKIFNKMLKKEGFFEKFFKFFGR